MQQGDRSNVAFICLCHSIKNNFKAITRLDKTAEYHATARHPASPESFLIPGTLLIPPKMT